MNHLLKTLKPIKPRLQHLHDGVIFIDLNGNILAMNPSAEKLFGIRPYKVKDLFTIESTFHKLLVDLSINKCKTELISLNIPKPKSFMITSMIIHDLSGHPCGIELIIQDRAKREIDHPFTTEKNSLLNAFNFRRNDFIIISDHVRQQFVYCSQCVRDMLGWENTDFTNGGWPFKISLFYPDELDAVSDYHNKEIKKRMEQPYKHDHIPIIYEYRNKNKNGTWVWLKSEVYILQRNNNHEIQYSLSFHIDITDKKLNDKSESILPDDFSYDNSLDFLLNEDQRRPFIQHGLTDREKEILKMISSGFSSKEIALRLELATTSVNKYRKNVMVKLNAKNTAELVRISTQMKLF